MHAEPVHFSSLDRVAERVLDHLRLGHHTALVGSPGCGMTTFVGELAARIDGIGFGVNRIDMRAKGVTELARELVAERPADRERQVLLLDHVGRLSPEDYRRLVPVVAESAAKCQGLCLWCGNLDARKADRELGVKLCSVPSAHVSFPMFARDELLTAYRAVADDRGCRWGDAVLYLMLDLCGTDLALVKSATEYLPGDWSDRLYEESVWDRVQEWLDEDGTVDAYRARLGALPKSCETTLALIRFGGKPQCLRAELIEEVDDGVRRLCLDGFIIPNLLPGFYQVRNLVVRFLLDESIRPELLFRRAASERAAALLQDTETMLRQVLAAVFGRVGPTAAREKLEAMQQPGEVIDKELSRNLLVWTKEKCPPDAVKGLNDLLMRHRLEFKAKNSVWETINAMMRRANVDNDGLPHIQGLDYLTMDQLGRLVLVLSEHVFPRIPDEATAKRVKEGWQEALAKVARLRNQVAHLRNVRFQDMEDLARTLERMRRDVIDYGGWKMPPISAEAAPEQAVSNEAQ
jgi:hypothetical protein